VAASLFLMLSVVRRLSSVHCQLPTVNCQL